MTINLTCSQFIFHFLADFLLGVVVMWTISKGLSGYYLFAVIPFCIIIKLLVHSIYGEKPRRQKK